MGGALRVYFMSKETVGQITQCRVLLACKELKNTAKQKCMHTELRLFAPAALHRRFVSLQDIRAGRLVHL